MTHRPVSARPRLRDSVVVQREGNELLFVNTATRRVKRFAVTEPVLRLLPLLDGTREVAELAQRVLEGVPAAQAVAGLQRILQLMHSEKLLSAVPDLAANAQRLGGEQAARYDRQLRLFQDFCDEGLSEEPDGVTLQEILGRGTVLICGIGGLGGWVAQSLAASGVGTLRLCDVDAVEDSNLTRQVLFGTGDVGRLKVDAAADRIRAVNPHVTVIGHDRRLGGLADLSELVDGCDLVINCADQPDTATVNAWVSDACHPHTPHLLGGGYAYHIGIFGITVLPGRSSCWDCTVAETKADHGRDRAARFIAKRDRAGATGSLAGLVGNALAWEALRVLTGMPAAFTNRWSEVDYWSMQVRSRAIPQRAECPRCHPPSA